MEKTCGACGTSSPDRFKFCPECGTALAAAGAQAEPAPGGGLDRYTPRHLAEKILKNRGAMEGERKQVTIMFSDVKGSTELAESMDPEEWHDTLDRFFMLLSEGVHRFEGTVNQYTGDGIMALFGAPISHEDHAQRACFAALWLRDALREYTEDIKRTRGLAFNVRIGINSGEVVVGKIGDDLRMDYTAQGLTVNLAQRMESLAAPGSAYVAESTARLAEGFVRMRDLGEFTVKGSSDPVRVFEIEGPGDLANRLDRSASLTRFAGRRAELKQLEGLLAETASGGGGVVAIEGEAGVGKSRLCIELAERARTRAADVVRAHGISHGRAVPLYPVLGLLRALFGVAEGEAADVVRDRIAGRTVELGPELAPALPLLYELLAVSDEPPEVLDPDERRRRLVAFTASTLRARARRRPLVLLLEDLHWFDPASETWLRELLEGLREGAPRLLVVLDHRPEFRRDWLDAVCTGRLRLEPLEAADRRAMLDALLGEGRDRLKDRLLAATEGNPFFLEEVVRSLAETGQLDADPESLPLPASVQSTVSARIDRLPEDQKAILQTAAVIGPAFGEGLLARVSGEGRDALTAALSGLEGAGLLMERSLYPERELAFAQTLVQEVAYRSQLRERRHALHARVAQALEAEGRERDEAEDKGEVAEAFYGSRLDAQAPLLAHHWEAAGQALAAARWHLRAAEYMEARDLDAALVHYRQALHLAEEAGGDGETRELAVRAAPGLLNAGSRSHLPPEEAREVFEAARERSKEHGDLSLRALVHSGYSRYLTAVQDLVSSARIAREAMRLADRSGDPNLAAVVVVQGVTALGWRGHYSQAERAIDKALGAPGLDAELRLPQGRVVPRLHALRAQSQALQGRIEAARGELETAFAMAGDGDEATTAWVGLSALHVEFVSGRGEETLRHAEAVLGQGERTGDLFLVETGHVGRGMGHLAAGRPEEALAALRESGRSGDEVPGHHTPWRLWLEARALCELGDRAAARNAAEQSLEASRAAGRAVSQAPALIAMARALLDPASPPRPDDVESLLGYAEDRLQAIGPAAYVPWIHTARAEWAAFRGDVADELAELRRALALWQEMGATGHVEALSKHLATRDA